ncbi:STAS domain-containing protein [Spirochaeta lutea]|uniref:Anti-sigma factor antagonist n=1 Tax=Spirochaeta lutea TaxID=1480694 RepID=A0A098QWE0_9SPIO|nr:STAS domain-containing protein [Spirochaeta lutea]KGE71846.1 anti-sigma F factor antagonist [Spirochaeta lutea]
MELSLRKADEIYIIDVTGELDLYNTSQLTELFQKLMERRVTRVVINMAAVSYLDSSGVGALITIYNQVQQKKIRFAISGVGGSALRVMELTRLTAYFPMKATWEEALESLRNS